MSRGQFGNKKRFVSTMPVENIKPTQEEDNEYQLICEGDEKDDESDSQN